MGLARLGICLPIHDEAIGMWVGGEVLACVQGEHVGLWERWPDAMVARMRISTTQHMDSTRAAGAGLCIFIVS